jgi:hypothetical protein
MSNDACTIVALDLIGAFGTRTGRHDLLRADGEGPRRVGVLIGAVDQVDDALELARRRVDPGFAATDVVELDRVVVAPLVRNHGPTVPLLALTSSGR